MGSWRIPCAQGVSPLTVFIIAHRARVVKPFFGLFLFFCPRLTAPSPRCGGVASVLPSSALFLPDARRCWFTFISRTTGLRAVEDFVIKDLPTLVGLASLTSSDFRALPCFPHLHLDYTTGFAVCQAFFLFFFEGEEDYSSSAASAASTSSQRSPAISQKSGYMACSPFLDCVLIISPKARVVYSQNIQIGINIFSHFATHFFLDFLLGVCYNFSGLGGFHGKIPSVIKQRGFLHTSEGN